MNVERVLAPNPGPFTGPGTNTYVIGDEHEVAVIDPGPVEASHERAIIDAIAGRRVAGVLVTHTHIDHAPLANPLANDLDVAAYGYESGPEFEPDEILREGTKVTVGTHVVEVLYTPGHSADHVCFKVGTTLFTGDHIMGGSSVMVEDLGPYLASLERLRPMGFTRLYPGHGPEIDQPTEVISWYLEHRRQREEEILAAVRSGAGTVGAVVEVVYRDVDSSLHPLAARSVIAHLRKLAGDGRVRFSGDDWNDPVEATEQRGDEATE
jgi:glyoxylase-like metal-dependent hydrolase (beta-lactamase superfamily II)